MRKPDNLSKSGEVQKWLSIFGTLAMLWIITGCSGNGTPEVSAASSSTPTSTPTSEATSPPTITPTVLPTYEVTQAALMREGLVNAAATGQPEYIQNLPEGTKSCLKSTVRMTSWTSGGSGTGQTVEKFRLKRAEGEFLALRVKTALHVNPDTDVSLNNRVNAWMIMPEDSEADTTFFRLSYVLPVPDENGYADMAYLTFISESPLDQEKSESFFTQQPNTTIPWEETSATDMIYSFGYPILAADRPQVVTATFDAEIPYPDGNVISLAPKIDISGSGTLYPGMSGGPNCNDNGENVGAMLGWWGQEPYKFLIEENPPNIRTLDQQSHDETLNLFRKLGFAVLSE